LNAADAPRKQGLGHQDVAGALVYPVFALVLMVMPLWIGLGASPIWDANEALYAETAREMLERSDFLHPTFNYAPRLQKPPFTYWAIAASYRLFGINEFAVRVPSALAATFLLGFLVWIVHRQTAILKAATPDPVSDFPPQRSCRA
jgi:4-amino-4-deoxy-L-arabinose transferase-like glycosyltransferase